MSDARELEQRRNALATQLAGLTATRDLAFRANSDALALQRAGVTQHGESEMNAFAASEVSGDSTITDLRQQIALIDDELERSGGAGQKARKLMRRLRR